MITLNLEYGGWGAGPGSALSRAQGWTTESAPRNRIVAEMVS